MNVLLRYALLYAFLFVGVFFSSDVATWLFPEGEDNVFLHRAIFSAMWSISSFVVWLILVSKYIWGTAGDKKYRKFSLERVSLWDTRQLDNPQEILDCTGSIYIKRDFEFSLETKEFWVNLENTMALDSDDTHRYLLVPLYITDLTTVPMHSYDDMLHVTIEKGALTVDYMSGDKGIIGDAVWSVSEAYTK